MSNNSNLEFRKIKSVDFLYEVNENGTILRNVKSKKQIKIFLDTHHSKSGYYAAFVSHKGKRKRLMIHKIVAECWLGDKPDGLEIDHIDRNTKNNHYSNLRYVTHSEQMKNRQLSDRIIKQATQNCYNYTMKYVAKPVSIKSDELKIEKRFESMTKCAEWVGEYYDVKSESVRAKLKKRRSHIYDFDIYYSECRD